MGLFVYELQGDFQHIFALWSREQYRNEHLAEAKSQKDAENDFMQERQFKGTKSILDIGCGDGKITAAMASKVPSGSVIGI